MTRGEFVYLLRQATLASWEFAKRYVDNDLPEAVRYHVLLNQSFDGNATAVERVYPEDDGREYACLTESEVVSLLFRDERCPEWIDVSVESQSATESILRLDCCGRFTDDPRLMYYSSRGMGPFGIKSPNLPFGLKQGSKFKLPIVQPCPAVDNGTAAPHSV
jgi:hypothetical protein